MLKINIFIHEKKKSYSSYTPFPNRSKKNYVLSMVQVPHMEDIWLEEFLSGKTA